jgi:hypothetical protein
MMIEPLETAADARPLNRRRHGLRLVAYPFLAALYPVLGLAGTSGALIGIDDLFRPILIALSVTLGFWLASRVSGSDPHRRAVVTFIAVVVFASYGYGAAVLWDTPNLRFLARDEVGLPIAALFLSATAWSARHSPRSYAGVSRWLNVTFAILVGWAAVGFVLGRVRPSPDRGPVLLGSQAVPRGLQPASTSAQPVSTSAQPHLFLIILDKYTGSRSLAANYGFENGGFEQQLEERGFIVPRHAHANYIHTFLALGAMLNWEYLTALADSLGAEEQRWELVYPMIEDNRTWRALKNLGYRFVFLPSAFRATTHNRFADLQLPDPGDLSHDFYTMWLRTTLLLPVLDRVCARGACADGRLPYVSESAESLDWKFARLYGLSESEHPLFVFAHLTLPHEPYVYDAECRHLQPYWPKWDHGPDSGRVKAAYVAQVQCLNRRLAELADSVTRRARRPTIIMFQSDHGHGRLGRVQPPLAWVPRSHVTERLDIFAAYRLPGAPAGLVHDSIGPVNALRAVMRHYYGLDLPPLEEASYWSSGNHPYRLTRLR